jgi:hypothetical protein
MLCFHVKSSKSKVVVPPPFLDFILTFHGPLPKSKSKIQSRRASSIVFLLGFLGLLPIETYVSEFYSKIHSSKLSFRLTFEQVLRAEERPRELGAFPIPPPIPKERARESLPDSLDSWKKIF